MKLKLTRDKRSVGFGFAEWELDASDLNDAIMEAIDKIVAEGVRIAVDEYECHAWFPIEWVFGEYKQDGVGGPPPSDPMTIYVELPLGMDDDESPRWTFTLTALVDQAIEGMVAGDTREKIGQEHIPSMRALRDGFLTLARKINERLP